MKQTKRLFGAVALSVALLTVCTGCKDSGSSTPVSTTAAPSTTASGTVGTPGTVQYRFTSGSTAIAISAESDPVIAALGAPKETFEAPSCAFEGTSYTYTYDHFKLETYPDNGVNRVYAVTLTDASVQTAEGCKVGDTADAVKTVCGEPQVASDVFLVYSAEHEALQFFLTGGTVTSIVYTYR